MKVMPIQRWFWIVFSGIGITAALDEIAQGEEEELQKKALFALSELPGGAGIPRLISIAKTHHNPAIRKSTIFWLSQSSDDRAIDAIIEIARGK